MKSKTQHTIASLFFCVLVLILPFMVAVVPSEEAKSRGVGKIIAPFTKGIQRRLFRHSNKATLSKEQLRNCVILRRDLEQETTLLDAEDNQVSLQSSEISNIKLQMTIIAADVDRLSGRLESQIAIIAADMDRLSGRIALKEPLVDLYDQSSVEQYNAMVNEFKSMQKEHNILVNKYNALFESMRKEHNTLVNKHNALSDAYNNKVNSFNNRRADHYTRIDMFNETCANKYYYVDDMAEVVKELDKKK